MNIRKNEYEIMAHENSSMLLVIR